MPGPLSYQWTGELLSDYNSITMAMVVNPSTLLVSYTMRLFFGAVQIDIRTVLGTTPRSYTPFDSDQIRAEPPPPGGYAFWHFYS